VEDEAHFVLDCEEYRTGREKMFRVVDERCLSKESTCAKEVRKGEGGKQRLMRILMAQDVADKHAAVAIRNAAMTFCKQAMKRRNAMVVKYLDQKT